MKTIRTLLLIAFTASTMSTARAADNPAVKKDMDQLQGDWSMVSGSADGFPVPESMLGNSKRICKGDETTAILGGQLFFKAKFTIDPSKKPKTIDYQMTEGPTKGKKQLGIYELDGDRVKFCFGAAGAERPADFTSKPGDGRTASLWKRQKEPTPQPASK